MVALVGLADGLSKSMLKLYVDRGVSLIVTRTDSVSPLSVTLPVEVAKDIEKLDGVAATCAGLVDFHADRRIWRAGGHSGLAAGELHVRRVDDASGRKLSDQDPGSKNVVVGSTLADGQVGKVGQTLTISDEKFHIVGIFKSFAKILKTAWSSCSWAMPKRPLARMA